MIFLLFLLNIIHYFYKKYYTRGEKCLQPFIKEFV